MGLYRSITGNILAKAWLLGDTLGRNACVSFFCRASLLIHDLSSALRPMANWCSIRYNVSGNNGPI
jgi:hypothetical protein